MFCKTTVAFVVLVGIWATGVPVDQSIGGPKGGNASAFSERQRRVREADFAFEKVVALAKAERCSASGIQSVWYSTRAEDASSLMRGKTPFGVEFAHWLNAYRDLSQQPWCIARLLCWQGAAVLDYRDRTGRIEHSVLRGNDFLRVSDGGAVATVQWLRYLPPISGNRTRSVSLLAQVSGELRQSTARKIWQQFSGLTTNLLVVNIRSDPWFVPETGYPSYNPFRTAATPPSEAEVKAFRSISCVGNPAGRTFRCEEQKYVSRGDDEMMPPAATVEVPGIKKSGQY